MSGRKFSWHTQKVQDRHGRYLDAELTGGSSPCAFYRCHDHYRPNMKGGHRHNHCSNAMLRKYGRQKALRQALRKAAYRKQKGPRDCSPGPLL